MDLELNDIQQELASTLHKYLRSEYDAAQREEILRRDEGISRQKWQAFAEMGLLGLSVPESYGGADMTFNEVAVVAEAFGRSLVLEPFLATAVLGTNALLLAGNEEQKQAILPGVCEGQTFLALAALEPRLRYAVDTPETTATATADGAATLRVAARRPRPAPGRRRGRGPDSGRSSPGRRPRQREPQTREPPRSATRRRRRPRGPHRGHRPGQRRDHGRGRRRARGLPDDDRG